jgi:hypothetical protein
MGKRKNPAAVLLGRKGGRIGGKRRAENRTADELSAIGRKGAEARWGKAKGRGGGRKGTPPAAPTP